MTRRSMAQVGLLIVLIGLWGGLLAHGQGETAPSPAFGLINSRNAVVRVGPDFAYPTVEQLPLDASVIVIGRAGALFGWFDGRQWLQIDYGGRSGWVLANYVRMGRAFNAIPITGLNLPRDRDGRVPDVFNLSSFLCDQWQGEFTQSGDFMAGAGEITFNFPVLTGAVNYSVVAVAPSGLQRTFDTPAPPLTVPLGRLNLEGGEYTWSVIPYWNDTPSNPRRAQQLCIARRGGTFSKPDTTPPTAAPGA